MEYKRLIIILTVIVLIVSLLAVFLVPSLKTALTGLDGDQVIKEPQTDPNVLQEEGRLAVGFPEFPVYGDAVLVRSATLVKPESTKKGFRAEWRASEGSVPEVMAWYLEELRAAGWQVEAPADPETYGEQIAKASRAGTTAFLRVELTHEGEVEIEVDIPLETEE